MASMLEFRTAGFNPYAVKYSPYYDSRIAVASAANYGIVGNGRLFCLGLGPQGIFVEKTFDTNDAQYDLAWSEINENQLLVACGDGSIKMYDVGVAGEFPVMNFHEHKREAFAVAWSPVTKDTFASSSWDGTVKIWSPARKDSLKTLPVGSCAYSTSYCPSNPQLISCVSSDSHLRVFDLRTPISSSYHLAVKIPIHMHSPSSATTPPMPVPPPPPPPPGQSPLARPPPVPPPAVPAEVLTHDWNKYREPVVATGGVDRAIRTFDIRSPSAGPLSLMLGHDYAVRRLAWSPHAADILVSASYDMTVRLWTDGSTMPPPGAGSGPGPGVPHQHGVQLGVMNRHTEFATGVDWCLFGVGGWVATVGWDERLLCWDANMMLQGPR